MRLALNFGPVFDCTVVQPLPLLEWRLWRPETLQLAVGGPIWRAGTPPSVRFVWDKLPPRPVEASLGRGKLALALGKLLSEMIWCLLAPRTVRTAWRTMRGMGETWLSGAHKDCGMAIWYCTLYYGTVG